MTKANPATFAEAIVADATVNPEYRALYIGGAGNLKVTMKDGGDVTFSGLIAGTLLPVSVTKVFDAGTTATLVIGLR